MILSLYRQGFRPRAGERLKKYAPDRLKSSAMRLWRLSNVKKGFYIEKVFSSGERIFG